MSGNVRPVPTDRRSKLHRGSRRWYSSAVHPQRGHGIFRGNYNHGQRICLAMERLHLPQQITIPMSVMFRFFPTVAEEWSAIGDAMRMRGIRFGGGKVGAILEYRIVPMMICSVKIGEELSQAALTRGLGGPVKRTNICKLGFHVQDVIFLLICLGAFAAQIYVLAARR